MKDVARRAGVSRVTVYRHASSSQIDLDAAATLRAS